LDQIAREQRRQSDRASVAEPLLQAMARLLVHTSRALIEGVMGVSARRRW